MIYTLTLNPSIDQYITVKKLIPSDKVKAEDVSHDAGGKGFNVTSVINELGGKSKAFGITGGQQGEALKGLLIQNKIDHHLCSIQGEIRTNLIIKDRSNGSQTRINLPGPRLRAKDIQCLLGTIEKVQPRPSYWALSGSIPPGVPQNIYQRLIACLQKRGERCVLDTDDEPLKLGLRAKPFLIKPNEFELERLTGRRCATQKEILAAGRRLTATAQVVAITLGKKGAYVITQDEAWHLTAPAVRVKSDVGAGDAFIGGFLTALDRGEGLMDASRWAIATSTSSVMNEGSAQCQRQDVERLVKRVKVKNVLMM